MAEAAHSLWRGYGGGEIMPLGGYSALLGTFATTFGGLAWTLSRRGKVDGAKLSTADLLLGGIATHKLTRIATKDWVTAPLRAPFTEFKEAHSGGEVVEKSRGGPMRRAVGDLMTCPYCSGPWIAGAVMVGLLAAPRAARTVIRLFAMVAVSDFLHRAYEALSAKGELLGAVRESEG